MIKFSPDGSKLALGSRENFVYVYEAHEDFTSYTKLGTCEVVYLYKLILNQIYINQHTSYCGI